jgi:hypothetical protein
LSQNPTCISEGGSVPLFCNWDKNSPIPMELESTVKINSRSKSTGSGKDLNSVCFVTVQRPFWRLSEGVHPSRQCTCRVSLVSGPAVWAKLLNGPSKERSETQELSNLLNIRWGPPISYGFCFIAPGLIPFFY